MRRSSLALVSYCIAYSVLYSLEPTLAIKLEEDFDFSTSKVGLFFGLLFFGQIVTGVISLGIPENRDKRPVLLVSYFLQFTAPLMVGPSEVLHFPNTPGLVGGGLFLGGGGRGLMVGFTASEAILGASRVFSDHQTRISDLVSSLYCFADGLAMTIFPIIGSALTEHLGFGRAQEVIGLLVLMVFILFLISSVCDWRRESLRESETLEK